jgi:hypothetical protein
VGCLYCGKEIGRFPLLRDDEFCSSGHRKEYERLTRGLLQAQTLNPLREDFDALLASMQTSESRTQTLAALRATPEELGQAAVKAARKRG